MAARFDGRRVRSTPIHELPGAFDRRDNRDVSGATAEVAAQPMLDFFLAWLRILGEERVGQQDHTRGAVTAFKAAFFPKRPLDRMKFIAFGQTFDGRHCFAIDLESRGRTGADGSAVHQNRAGAANLHFATFSRSLETQVIAQKVGE
jgi:hypothetical protein